MGVHSAAPCTIKKNELILCGDWNVNFLHDSVKLQALHSVLLSHNLTSTAALPTRVTKLFNKCYDNK